MFPFILIAMLSVFKSYLHIVHTLKRIHTVWKSFNRELAAPPYFSRVEKNQNYDCGYKWFCDVHINPFDRLNCIKYIIQYITKYMQNILEFKEYIYFLKENKQTISRCVESNDPPKNETTAYNMAPTTKCTNSILWRNDAMK